MWYGIAYLVGVLCGMFAAFSLVEMSRCENCCQKEPK